MQIAQTKVVENIKKAQPVIGSLQKIPPKTVLLQLQCRTCKETFSISANYILSMTRQYGFFRPTQHCKKCWIAFKNSKKAQEAKEVVPTKKVMQAKPPAPKVVREKPQEVESKRSLPPKKAPFKKSALTHKPFAALASLKVKK